MTLKTLIIRIVIIIVIIAIAYIVFLVFFLYHKNTDISDTAPYIDVVGKTYTTKQVC